MRQDIRINMEGLGVALLAALCACGAARGQHVRYNFMPRTIHPNNKQVQKQLQARREEKS